MAAKLRQIGFQVIERQNATKTQQAASIQSICFPCTQSHSCSERPENHSNCRIVDKPSRRVSGEPQARLP